MDQPAPDFDNLSLPALVAWAGAAWGDRPAIVDAGEHTGGRVTLSYRELGERIDGVARALVASGLEAGDTVAVWAPNCWQWVAAALGAARAGAVLVPVNTRFKGSEAAYVLAKARVKVLFVVDGFLGYDYRGSLAGESLPDLGRIVDLITDLDSFTAGGDGANRAELQAEVERRTAAVAAEDIGAIMFTSGTTGHPKGVLVRGGAVIRAFHGWTQVLGVRPGDPYLLVNPYFHAFGFNSGIVVCLMTGACNVPVAVYDPTEVLAIIERERIAVFPGPPALFQGMLNHPDLDRYDISSLRGTLTGAATIPTEMVIAMRERLGFETIVTAFGMTETSGIASYTRADDPPEVIAGTSGRAIPDVELRVVDDAGHEVPRGTEGELLVRGYVVTPGYLDDPEQTAEAIDADGWLHTGDIAVMDEAGYIDITDRKKDMFIVGGFNAYPAEIERMMVEHPLVGLVAVVGVPDARLGEVGAAFVVPSPEGAPEEAELIAWCRERMANYKVPRHVWVVDTLPLTASNKVRKPELRAEAAARLPNAGG